MTNDTATFTRATLGRTGRAVHRLGVASSFGLGGADLEAAVEEHGVDYLYWGSLRRSGYGKAIRALCARGLRDRLFVVVQSYSRLGSLVRPSLCMALRRLGIERADMLLLGMWNAQVPRRILDAALRCQERGLTAHVGVSTHQRTLVPALSADERIAVVHFRYNAVHRGAEREIFPALGADPAQRAGTVAFTATCWRKLLKPAGDLPAATAPDCYRYVLTRPEVDVCMTGPRHGADLRAALRALERGPMDDDELARMNALGARIYGK